MITRIFILFFLFLTNLFSQLLVDSGNNSLNVQPAPIRFNSLGKSVVLNSLNNSFRIIANNNNEIKSANYLNYLLKNNYGIEFKINPENEVGVVNEWVIKFSISKSNSFINSQHYRIHPDINKKEIEISSPGQLGLLFGAVTFLDFVRSENGAIKINLFEVDDWPEYSRRIFSTVLKPDRVEDMLNYALLNKMET
ncbi:MAG: hypothetical protein GYA14_08300, partial [Ignavibacteria bacterium]|nr:hypothetical protein [Ignavibacteria bacterium]